MASKSVPVRTEMPLWAKSLIELCALTGRASVSPRRELRNRSLDSTPSIVAAPPS
jgi:hypothetical protein